MPASRRSVLASLIILVATLLACGGGVEMPAQGPMPPGASFSGDWETNWGPVVMKQEGSKVTGVYTYKGILGVIKGDVNGNTLDFNWAETKGGAGSGLGRFVMNADGGSFSGSWGSSDRSSGGEWSGTKK